MSGLEASMIKARNAEKRGDFSEAERLYGAVLKRFPANVRARKGLDAVFRNRALSRLASDAPPQAALDALAHAYGQGRMADAIAQAEALIQSHPGAAPVHNLLGAAYLTLGQPARAEAALRRARAQGLASPPICNNLGMALAALDRADEAEAAYREAIALDPHYAITYNNLGNVLKDARRFAQAVAAYEAALAILPDYTDAYNNMGLALEGLGRADAAQAAYRRTLALKPDHAAACNNLANLLTSQGDLDAALALYDRAVAIDPANADAHLNRGNALRHRGDNDAAVAAYRRAHGLRPGHADTWIEEAKALAQGGRLDAAIAAFDQALAIQPLNVTARAHRLFYQAHVCDWRERDTWTALGTAADGAIQPFAALVFEDDPAAQLRRSRAWARKAFPPTAEACPKPAPAADGRIRIGYFSADFHDHATLFLMAGLLREHDRSRFAIHAFSYGPDLDSVMRRQMIGHLDSFTAIGALADSAVADLARGMGLDIAVDLKGYTQNGRSRLFAQRLAPVQIAYLGYPGSSGTDFIDYLVCDPVVVPHAEAAGYSEKLLMLPASYQPNDDARTIAGEAGTRADHGLPEGGFVFCCFNHSYKIGPREFAIWMRLLRDTPGSVLWLLRSNPLAEANLRREAAARGLAPERVIFASSLPQAEHLARLRHADLFLDTFNVNAHTTASDALWAGLPLVTKAGRQFAARVGASALAAVGLPELIADSEQAYEGLCRSLAADPARLSGLRAKLAENRLSQPLFDTAGYAREIEAAFAQVHAEG